MDITEDEMKIMLSAAKIAQTQYYELIESCRDVPKTAMQLEVLRDAIVCMTEMLRRIYLGSMRLPESK